MIDRCGRNIDYMRISVTDRCNLRCIYCMPASGVQSFCHSDVLSYEEIVRVVRQAAALGIRHLRVTGGEPMARKGCMELIDMLRRIPGIETIALTTNAMLLDGRVQEIRSKGLTSMNISVDSLARDRGCAGCRHTGENQCCSRAGLERRGADAGGGAGENEGYLRPVY